MNKRKWKEFITKRSTIWTLSLCMTGVIVLGGITALDKTRNMDELQTEEGSDQTAYLEEELADAENLNDTADTILDGAETEDFEEVSGNAVQEETAASQAETEADTQSSETTSEDKNTGVSSSDTAGSSDYAASDSNDSSDAEASEPDTTEAEDTSSKEASSSNIISEQTLLDAGISFGDEQSLLWPSAGTILIDYSMDQSVYFPTLNQYKYNPALIIGSNTGNQVLASAKGIVESVAIDEETGTTLILNIGNGYRLTYGQLMEPAVSEGDLVEAGDLLAYISEPTKYYSTEGSNLYFSMTKDGTPVDPVLYLE